MIIVFSHANYVEYEEITERGAIEYMYLLDMFDSEVLIDNYSDIGGHIKTTLKELSKRIRFYDDIDGEYMNTLSKDYSIMDSLLAELDKLI